LIYAGGKLTPAEVELWYALPGPIPGNKLIPFANVHRYGTGTRYAEKAFPICFGMKINSGTGIFLWHTKIYNELEYSHLLVFAL
jgi:hypothetical protein